jgi:hypothetical protein
LSLLDNFIGTLASLQPAAAKERTRAQQADDEAFCIADYLYYFELILPASVTGNLATNYLIPLVLGPQSITMDEPFTVEITKTLGGGLYCEENGVLERNLRISGNTGWAPIAFPIDQQPGFLTAGGVVGKSYSRSLPFVIATALSGQRHFQLLQDAFRTYADAKANPSYAAGVSLLFHNPRESEDWQVVPRNFNLSRSTANTLGYPYSIELSIVGPAKYTAAPVASPDQTVLNSMRNALQTASNFVTTVTADVNQLTAVELQMRLVFKSMDAVLINCFSLLNAASSFVSGAATLIQAPYALCALTAVLIEASLAQAEAAAGAVANTGALYSGIPAIYVATWRRVVDSLLLLGTHPESFVTDTASKLALLRANQSLSQQVSSSALATAATTANPKSFAAATASGSTLLPSDAAQAQVTSGTQTAQAAFTSTSTYVVQQGDTLVSIAAKLMGDARLWVYLAIANGLKLPLGENVATKVLQSAADTQLTSGMLSLGQTIYIPNYSQPVSALPAVPVLGVATDAPAATQVIGTDYALNFSQGGSVESSDTETLVDLVLDPVTRADCLTVTGAKNMQQAILLRLNTEQGTDQLMPDLGLQPIIGLGLAAADVQAIQYRMKAALLADPRISDVTNISTDNSAGPDAVYLTATAQVTGLGQGVTVTTA